VATTTAVDIDPVAAIVRPAMATAHAETDTAAGQMLGRRA
jgi:hypothetical protein